MLRASRRWLIIDDPESAAGNSPGSFEELFRSRPEASLTFLRYPARVGLCGRGGSRTLGPDYRCPLQPALPWWRAGPRRSNKHYNDSKHPRVALYTVFLYLSSYTSSVSSPVPWHLVQVPFFQGWSPVPPHSGHRIGSGSSFMALFVFVFFCSEGQAHCRAEAECP